MVMSHACMLLSCFLACLSHGLQGQSVPQELTEAPFILGEIKEFQSGILSEKRRLNIYLPEGYHADDTTRYPVLYLLDGSADEDFIHIVGLIQFANFSWINLWPKTIVVGISNVDRRRDFTFPTRIESDKKASPTSGGSASFISFLEKELQPFVENMYRVNDSRTLIGQSLGGLLACEVLLRKPELFNQYIIVSPSLWWDDGSLLEIEPSDIASQNPSIYVAVGKEGKVMIRAAKKFASLLRKNGVPRSDIHYVYFPDMDHANILHAAVYHAFETMK